MELPSFSLLDILTENLKKAGRKSYLHRMVYVFDYHKLSIDGAEINLQEELHSMISHINEAADEPISGLLLFYDKYGINMIEGSEESIFRHFQDLTDSPVISQCVPRIKILLTVTHIAQRIMSRWNIFFAQPQTLLERLEPCSVEETGRRIRTIVVKLYNLWNHLRFHSMSVTRTATADHLSDRMTTNLPEFERLEFVLSTPALKDLREFVDTHRTVQQPRLYQVYGNYVVPIKASDKDAAGLSADPLLSETNAPDIQSCAGASSLACSNNNDRDDVSPGSEEDNDINECDGITELVWPPQKEFIPFKIFNQQPETT